MREPRWAEPGAWQVAASCHPRGRAGGVRLRFRGADNSSSWVGARASCRSQEDQGGRVGSVPPSLCHPGTPNHRLPGFFLVGRGECATLPPPKEHPAASNCGRIRAYPGGWHRLSPGEASLKDLKPLVPVIKLPVASPGIFCLFVFSPRCLVREFVEPVWRPLSEPQSWRRGAALAPLMAEARDRPRPRIERLKSGCRRLVPTSSSSWWGTAPGMAGEREERSGQRECRLPLCLSFPRLRITAWRVCQRSAVFARGRSAPPEVLHDSGGETGEIPPGVHPASCRAPVTRHRLLRGRVAVAKAAPRCPGLNERH